MLKHCLLVVIVILALSSARKRLKKGTNEEDECFSIGSCTAVIDQSSAQDEISCWRQCRAHSSCNYFTFFESAEKCFFFEICENLVTDCTDCITGHFMCVPKKDYQVLLIGGNADPTRASLYTLTESRICSDPAMFEQPERKFFPRGAIVNNSIHVCGGTLESFQCIMYEKERDEWQKSITLKPPLINMVAIPSLDKLSWAILGGGHESGLSDGVLNWNQGWHKFESTSAKLPLALDESCLVRVNRSHALIMGGSTSLLPVNNVFWFNEDLMEISEAKNLPVLKTMGICLLVTTMENDPEVWSIGGLYPSAQDNSFIYNVISNEWREGPKFATTIVDGASVEYQKSGLIFGGPHGSKENVHLLDVSEAFLQIQNAPFDAFYSDAILVESQVLNC